jgi:hypothetical protein
MTAKAAAAKIVFMIFSPRASRKLVQLANPVSLCSTRREAS